MSLLAGQGRRGLRDRLALRRGLLVLSSAFVLKDRAHPPPPSRQSGRVFLLVSARVASSRSGGFGRGAGLWESTSGTGADEIVPTRVLALLGRCLIERARARGQRDEQSNELNH